MDKLAHPRAMVPMISQSVGEHFIKCDYWTAVDSDPSTKDLRQKRFGGINPGPHQCLQPYIARQWPLNLKPLPLVSKLEQPGT